jgi:hypothetical protein
VIGVGRATLVHDWIPFFVEAVKVCIPIPPRPKRADYRAWRVIEEEFRRLAEQCSVWSLYQNYGSLRVRYPSSPLAVMAYKIKSNAPNHCSRVLPDA